MKLSFRPLERADFPLFARWLAVPHVARWWREPATVEHVDHEYGGCTRGDYTTRVYVVMAAERPIGIIQCYLLKDYPEHEVGGRLPGGAGIDYLIGEVDYVGRGYGAAMIREFVDTVVRDLYPQASGVLADPEARNGASIGALERAGFEKTDIVTGEDGPEQLMMRRF